MTIHGFLLDRSKLTPPSPPRQSLHRPRVTERLLEAVDYRLTLIHAGAGYGKSTALAALVDGPYPMVWYHLQIGETSPLQFLLHLLYGFEDVIPGIAEISLVRLEQWNHIERPFEWRTIISLFLNDLSQHAATILLVVDDAHVMNDLPEIENIMRHLIDHAPPCLHILLATRTTFIWNELLTWRVRGQVLEISESELAFTIEEVDDLYRYSYKLPLSVDHCYILTGKTEGWAMVLPLVWQRLRYGDAASIQEALDQLSGSAGDLFRYLAQETWDQQPQKVRKFLRDTSILNELTADLCDCVRDKSNSNEILIMLSESGFFLFGIDDVTMRYHHLFRELLQQQLSKDEARYLHSKAAECYAKKEQGTDAAIKHCLAAGEYAKAANFLTGYGRLLITQGRLELLAEWIGSIPPTTLTQFPALFIYLGDIARLHSRFEESQGWYQEAENRFRESRDLLGLGQALRGQARVYLDTVNPRQAEVLLEEALRISDGKEDRESQARLLDLMAENRLNQGRTNEAETLQAQAMILRQQDRDDSAVPMRLLLRTGRLNQALFALEEMATEESHQPVQKSRAHRETLLLLSLVLSFLGQQERALQTAVEGTKRGRELESLFVTAVGWMRQGHAWLLLKNTHGYEEAQKAYKQAIELSDQIQASRLKVEAYWGLVQVYGFRGQIELAMNTANNGISLAEQAGDEWVVACIRVAMGAAFVLNSNNEQAASWLKQAEDSFHECNDLHGQAVTRLWQCLLWNNIRDFTRLGRDIEQLLSQVRDHAYDFILLRRTLLGPPDIRVIVPLLLYARESNHKSAYADYLLDQLGLADLKVHPGYQLRVHGLGSFHVLLGIQELGPKSWGRQKARQLFQLLLTYRRTQMHREQITEILWPELDSQNAARDFKVAYTTLCRVLEPNRPRNRPSAFILRDGSRYGIRPEADLWFDVTEFDSRIAKGDRLLHNKPVQAREHYRIALSMYQGSYLQEYPYEEWANQERMRLLNRYLRTAERLGRSLIQEEEWEQVLAICYNLLEQDNCWEPAYQMLIITYANLGNQSEAKRSYSRCEQVLRMELEITPSVATMALLQDILQSKQNF